MSKSVNIQVDRSQKSQDRIIPSSDNENQERDRLSSSQSTPKKFLSVRSDSFLKDTKNILGKEIETGGATHFKIPGILTFHVVLVK